MRIAPRREVGAPDIDSACRKSHRLLGARTDASLRSSLAALRREVDVREENSTCTFIHIKNQVFLSLRIHLQCSAARAALVMRMRCGAVCPLQRP